MELDVVTEWLLWILDTFLVDVPGLVETVVAVPEGSVLVVYVLSTPNIEALSTIVSNVSLGSSIEGRSLVDLTNPWSNSGSNSDSITLLDLVGNDELSLFRSSDSSSSLVKDEPLSSFSWEIVSDSESELVSTDVFTPEEGSVGSHSRSDLEFDSILEWLLWIFNTLLINVPGLVEAVVAVPPGDVLVVLVLSTPDIEAFLTVVSDVSDSSTVPGDSLSLFFTPGSDDSSLSDSESLSSLVGDNLVSLRPGSDSLSSIIEGPPLSVVLGVVVSDSKSELVLAILLVEEEGSVSWHSRLDLELNSVGKWVLWIFVGDSVNVPSLIGTVMASPPDDVSLVSV